ncbi:ATP-binding protein [Litorisediminicola beolgyonensis]|uniref:histidine kinase n=1 Tax=Litorisediminicola beolgyonensis TaxID=1173614 RepID=A0ABW3ZGL5_9RHOB
MKALRAALPSGLIGQFMLLLAAALIAANLVALALLSVERLRLDRAAVEAREIERVVSLLPAVEAARPGARGDIARRASTRFSRVSVEPTPLVPDAVTSPRSLAFTDDLAAALPDREARGAIRVRRSLAPGAWHREVETVALSVRLSGTAPARPQWLNIVSRAGPPRGPGIDDDVFALVLGLSLAAVLGVGWLFLRRLTRPLVRLTEATRAAGAGDRSVRVAVEGSREVRDLASAFNDMQARIGRFDAERMRTLAAVGHDLRTPITSLRIRVELLDEEEALPMIRTLDEMTVMAEGLVSYAKGAGEAEETQRVDLDRLLAELAQERGGEITASVPLVVAGRPVALKRAIGNLVDNAIRYGGAARIALAEATGAARITIEDDGPGIADERLEAMFEPFVRGEDSRSAETGGAGLGLAIARNIVLAHGGRVDLDNTGHGLRATVTLPLGKVMP